MPTKVKICGITQVATAKAFVSLPIDAIGLVFYDKSPRYIRLEQANKIINALPPFVNRVALFVNAKPEFIKQVITETSIDTLQFHGDETPKQCEQYGLPYIKAIRLKPQTNLIQLAQDYQQASGLLLDAYHKSVFGGTGQTFDWSLAQLELPLPIILAGGLLPSNIAQAIFQVNPYGVDVSSGVETDGVKDLTKITQFLNNLQNNDK